MFETSYQSLEGIKLLRFEPILRQNQTYHVFSGHPVQMNLVSQN